MFNPKIIASFGIVGFALSFIIGLIYNAIATAFVNALIYAVVFGVLGVAVSFIYQKFLSVGQSTSESDSSDLSSAQEQVKGSRVDITISDDSLPEDEESPKFVVNTKKTSAPDSVLREEIDEDSSKVEAGEGEVQDLQNEQNFASHAQNVSSAQVASAAPQTDNQQVPVTANDDAAVVENVEQQNENKQNNEGFVPIQLGSQPKTEDEPSNTSLSDDENSIDSLPDIGELTIGGDGDDSNIESSDNFVSDSDFASAGVQSSPATSFTDNSGGAADAALMAKAISTALARDE